MSLDKATVGNSGRSPISDKAGTRRLIRQVAAAGLLVLTSGLLVEACLRAALLIIAALDGPVSSASVQIMDSLVLAVPAAFAITGLIPGFALDPSVRVERQVTTIAGIFVIVQGAVLLADRVDGWSSGVWVVAGILDIGILPFADDLARRALRQTDLWGDDTVLLGLGTDNMRVRGDVDRNADIGWRITREIAVTDVHDAWENVATLSHETSAYTLVVTSPGLFDGYGDRLRHLPFRRIVLMTNLTQFRKAGISGLDMGGRFGIEVDHHLNSRVRTFSKQAFDSIFALPLCLLAAPVIAVLAGVSCALFRHNPFYFQEREGAGARRIKVWKLRSMYTDADARLERHLAENPAMRAEWERSFKLRADPRILPVIGHFIRKTSLDELPQLFNVLKGEMSLVGPRPFPYYHLARFEPEFRALRASVRPGITGLWQISERSDADLAGQEALDRYYIRNWSFWLDWVILMRTLPAVIMARGAR